MSDTTLEKLFTMSINMEKDIRKLAIERYLKGETPKTIYVVDISTFRVIDGVTFLTVRLGSSMFWTLAYSHYVPEGLVMAILKPIVGSAELAKSKFRPAHLHSRASLK